MKDYLHNICELIALIVAIIYYPHLKKSFMKWFLPFLAFIFIGELIASYKYYHDRSWLNIYIYYLIGMAESVFYGYIFYQLNSRRSYKKKILYFIAISTIAYFIGLFFFATGYTYFILTLIISGFFLSLIALGYTYTKFVDDDETLMITESGFWIAVGVSIFFSGISIVLALHDFIVRNNLILFGVKLYNLVPRVLCIILYASISIAIILCKKKNKISS